ncbi:putative acyl-CoA dehydrogenase FadE10 [Chlamydiales bacterium STE3]|nr:putative acyl-CoA dehydrogenase FadE10 [Chlamydiales bacterium STE3]
MPDTQETEGADEALFEKSASKEKREALEITESARDREARRESFAGQLLMGDFKPKIIFPFPEQTVEDRKIGDDYIAELMPFLMENLDPEEVDATRTIPEKVIKELGRLGAFAMKVPKEYGGLGFSQTNYNRVVQKVASYCGGTAVLLSAHQSIGVPQPLRLYGTEEQKKKYLTKFKEGWISAFALTEPDVGSDPVQMSADAKLSEDGSHYVLNGTKLWCTNGALANIIVVMAKTASKFENGKEKKQITAFLLEMDTPGIEIAHRCEFMGLGGIYNALITFKDVKIPKENVIWEEGRGLALALATINVGRLTLPAASAGAAKQCLSIARRWGANRVQWGMPIGLHEVGREKIAYIAATTFAIDAVGQLTSYLADLGEYDTRIEAAMAKLFCTEALWKIVDLTMQLRGGRGYEKGRSLKARGEVPYPVERIMRDCRINLILEGTSEIMRLFLAREAIDPHLKLALPLLSKKTSFSQKLKAFGKAFGFYSRWYPSQIFETSSSYKDLESLGKYFAFIQSNSHKLAREIFSAMVKYKQGLEQKQLHLGRLMEIGTELFAMSATVSYAATLHQKNPKDSSPILLADAFCQLSKRRIKGYFKALSDNDDKVGHKLAEKVLNQEFKWLEEGIVWMGPDE